MVLPDDVEHYTIPMQRVKLEVHHQPTGATNYWLFSSVAAIELREEDIGPLGELLQAYDKEVINRKSTLHKVVYRVLLVAVVAFIIFIIGQGVVA